jgi:hypothetical protein
MNYAQNIGNSKYAYGLIPFLFIFIVPYFIKVILIFFNLFRKKNKFKKAKLSKLKLSKLWNYVDLIFNIIFLIYIIIELGFIDTMGH